MPQLQPRFDAISRDRRFTNARIGSIRHGDVIHTIGLSCHPIKSSSPHDSYSISVNIFSHGGLMMRGFVTWSQPYINSQVETPPENAIGSTHRSLAGYTVRETMTRPFYFRAGESVEDFAVLLPPLYDAFDRGVRRGHPPGALRHFWNRLVISER
jgi:hypothetical protein